MGALERSIILLCLSKTRLTKDELAKVLHEIDKVYPILSYNWINDDSEELQHDIEVLKQEKLIELDNQSRLHITPRATALIDTWSKSKASLVPKIAPIINSCLLKLT
jgi:hypothetical protein